MNYSENLMLATTQEFSKIKYPCEVGLKLDGVRLYYLEGCFYTRTGKRAYLPSIERKINTGLYIGMEGFFIDMEVTVNEGKKVDRPIVSGYINSALANNLSESKQNQLMFNVIDVLPKLEFKNRMTSETSKTRQSLWGGILWLENFKAIPTFTVNNKEGLQMLYLNYLQDGYEGVVVKPVNHTYDYKRSKQWARFKETKTADLKCIHVNSGQGKYINKIGALILQGDVKGSNITVKVGSGLTDDDRSKPFDYYVGKTIEVKYNHVTKSDSPSLFLPRFVCVREDK